ncbi:MAG TPA: DUF4920 domain-containing protein [Rubricoccaceae bacterium]|nr:DUF4920 domain-containing protein [Rubricoccaceae bacterium]
MKRLLPLLLPALLLAACAQDGATTAADEETLALDDELVADLGTVVGEDPGDGPVVFVDEVVMHPEQYENMPVRVAGTVSEVCQMAGCWFTFQNEAGVAFRVSVPRDEEGYVFTFPKDVAGRSAVVEGTLTVEETDVATLRHLAQDRGASAEEVAAITAPERTLVLSATGARLESATPQNA